MLCQIVVACIAQRCSLSLYVGVLWSVTRRSWSLLSSINMQESSHHSNSASSCCERIQKLEQQASAVRVSAAEQFADLSRESLKRMHTSSLANSQQGSQEVRQMLKAVIENPDALLSDQSTLINRVEASVRRAIHGPRSGSSKPTARGSGPAMQPQLLPRPAAPPSTGIARAGTADLIFDSIGQTIQKFDSFLVRHHGNQDQERVSAADQLASEIAGRADLLRSRVKAMKEHVYQALQVRRRAAFLQSAGKQLWARFLANFLHFYRMLCRQYRCKLCSSYYVLSQMRLDLRSGADCTTGRHSCSGAGRSASSTAQQGQLQRFGSAGDGEQAHRRPQAPVHARAALGTTLVAGH